LLTLAKSTGILEEILSARHRIKIAKRKYRNMKKENAIKLFQDKHVRVHWDGVQEKWFFSIIDVIAVLTGNERPRKYWSDLKSKLKTEGSEVSAKIGQLKMQAADGKMRITDVADTENIKLL